MLIPDANLFKEAFEKGQATNASLSSGSAPAEESSASAPAETAPEPVNVCPSTASLHFILCHSRRECLHELRADEQDASEEAEKTEAKEEKVA